ncbi:amino acid adenylation domain-containing protein [Micromonospora sp. NPDC049048]|uniref:amino acid adenylation domain-containing protein n=1 Tax=Micromonospora sp. NPDC049048 TaxID=3364263 RepID=UPI0037172659
MTALSASVAGTLLARAEQSPDRVILRYLDGAGQISEQVTYRQLVDSALAAARLLTDAGATGQPVLLLARADRNFLDWFFGCLFAGAIAVPMPPATGRHRIDRLVGAATDAQVRVAVGRPSAAAVNALPDVRWLAPDSHREAPALRGDGVRAAGPVVLQYTSGSTSRPRGVMLTDECLLHNVGQMVATFDLRESDEILIWLPPHHDMGLIGGLLTPVLNGIPVSVLDAADFARRPLLWLETLAARAATVSGGPNAGYETLARTLEQAPPDVAGLDLSRWRVAFVGAEPVQASTLERFAAAAAPYGFDRAALRPCYGLAEATLLVTCAAGPPDVTGDADATTPPVSCGPPVRDTTVQIVDAGGLPVATGTVGEVLVGGPGVAAGYWKADAATDRVFGARVPGLPGRFLRTGDLGFLTEDGELVPTGRVKDLLIVHGRNVYPADLELAAQRAVTDRPVGMAAAFHLEHLDEIAVLVECGSPAGDAGELADDALLHRVRAAVAAHAQHPPALVGMVRMGLLPRTTSGKIRRADTREQYRAGRLRLSAELAGQATVADPAAARAVRDALAEADPATRPAIVAEHLRDLLGAAGEGDDPDAGGVARYGLDSLAQMSLVVHLETVAGGPLSYATVLRAGSLDEVAETVAVAYRPDGSGPAGEHGSPQDGPEPPAAPPPGVPAPTGSAEQAMYLLEQMSPGGTTLAAAAEVEGVDADTIGRWVDDLVARHEALRTAYRSDSAGLVRVVVPVGSYGPVVRVTDGTGWSSARVADWLSTADEEPFDLAVAPLFRVELLRRGPDRQLLVLCVPHVVADFAALTGMLSELMAAGAGRPPTAVPPSYREHLAALADHQAGPAVAAAGDHFARLLRGIPATLALPGAPARHPVADAAAELDCDFGPELTARVRELASQERTTTFVVLLAIYQALLHTATGQSGIAVAVPMSGRTDPRFADTVGLFMNQVPVVSRLGAGTTLRDLVHAARDQVLTALDHQRCPLPEIAARVGGAGPSTLFETMFVYYQASPGQRTELAAFAVGADAELRVGGLTWRSVRVQKSRDTLPLTVAAATGRSGLRFVFRYLVERFDPAAVRQLAEALPRLAARLLADPAAPVDPTVAVAAGPQSSPAPVGIDRTDPSAPEQLVERLWHSVRTHPRQLALVDAHRQLTYEQLWRRSGDMASALRTRGVLPGDIVALMHTRDVDAIVATMAVLRAGAAYVHLSLDSPLPRLRRIVADSAPRLVLTCPRHHEDASSLGVPVVPVAELGTGVRASGVGEDPLTGPHPEPLPPPDPAGTAYVSYTSGSSGQPKGVVVSHRAVAHATDAYADRLAIGPGDVVAGVSSLGWDIVVGDVFGALLRAATLCLVPDEVTADGAELAAFLAGQRVSVLATTPHRWRLLLDAGWQPPSGFRAVCGGDAMTVGDAGRFRELGVHVWNFYGPTETVLWSCCADLRRWDGQGPVPIGHDLTGYHSYVVDDRLAPVPAGDTGELCVGGAAVADGYLGDPRLTASRFVPDPHAGVPGARMYRTGDLVRIHGRAGLTFVGRGDDQVKVRGHRVELGEVEVAIAGLPGIAAAAAAALPAAGAGPAELVAFVVAGPRGRPEQRSLLRAMADALPRYMLPSRVVWVPRLPVTANGKLDRAALRGLTGESAVTAGTLPTTPTERLVAEVFGTVLQVGPVYADDDFFLIGGHSLRAVQAAAQLAARAGVPVSVRTLFLHTTVAALAAQIDGAAGQDRSGGAADAPPHVTGGSGEVTPGQYRLWFDHLLGGRDAGMVLPFLVRVDGRIDGPALRDAFDVLVDRHESLRTVVRTEDGAPRQVPGPRPVLRLVAVGDPDDGAAERLGRRRCAELLDEAWQLAVGPLVRCEALLAADHAVLVFVVHHAVFDGWSARVLFEEFGRVYTALLDGTAPDLPALPVTAYQAAELLRRTRAGAADRESLDALVGRLRGAPRLRLPGPSGPNPAPPGEQARKRRQSIGDSAHRAARRLGATPYAVVTSALLVVLRDRCGQDDLVVGLDLAGRERVELESLVGYFGNQLPMRVDLGGLRRLDEVARRVGAEVRDLLGHQSVGYEQLVAELRRTGSETTGGLFDVKVVHQYVTGRLVDPAGRTEFNLLDSGWASPANPVGLWVWDDGGSAVLELHHRLDACAPAWADDVFDQIVAVLGAVADNPECEVADLMGRSSATDDTGEDFPSFDDIEITELGGPVEPAVEVRRAGATSVLMVSGEGSAREWLAGHPDTWRDGLDEHGAVLLRGFGVDDPQRLAEAVAEVFGEPYQTTEHPRQVLGDRVVMPIDYPAELELYWHNEDSFNRTWPARIAFACQQPAEEGGETTVVDGLAVLQAMDADTRKRFTELGVCYVRRFLPGLGLPWTAVFGTDDREEVTRRCAADGVSATWDGDVLTTRAHRPAVLPDRQGRPVWFAQVLHWHEYCLDPETRLQLAAALDGVMPRSVTYGDGTPIPEEVVAELIDISRANEWPAPWIRGDLLLVDNRRMAHGRRAYRGQRRIMVSLGDPQRQ